MARLILLCVSAVLSGSILLTSSPAAASSQQEPKAPLRAQAIARAQVWMPTDVASADIKTGPKQAGALPFLATITCDYVPKVLSGASAKFVCASGDNEMTVKFGDSNAEVYGEVATTRLLWALGFGADPTYPVRVVCRGCPAKLGGTPSENGDVVFDPAMIERRTAGRELYRNSAWSWRELNKVKEKEGGAPLAHLDALKLLAVFVQHTDSKRQQQRIECLDWESEQTSHCEHPFLVVNDVGLTFGSANTFNSNKKAVSLVAWASRPIWKAGDRCVANMPRSWTGTLENPVISEAGRSFLADLLSQLSDDQIRALFEVARVTLRPRDPERPDSGSATIEEWTEVFKKKRAEIVDKRCS